MLAAVCDTDEAVLDRWRDERPDVKTYDRYEDMLGSGEIDAVFIATPPALHARQAVEALQADLHVLSEVYAASTVDECWQLVETVRDSGKVYMMAENYCYTRPNMMVLNMMQCGAMGEPTYAEGAYIHDCRALMFDETGELTWRGRSKTNPLQGNWYPTHSLGPVAQWLSVNRGDRLLDTATFVTRPEGAWRFVADRMGADHPLASPGRMASGDSATTVITTQRGCVIVLRVDTSSPRPHNMTHYALQGTRGSYLSERWHGEAPLVWLEEHSSGRSPDGSAQWQPLWELAHEFEHPRWRAEGDVAEAAGHGGGDYFVLADFVDAILEGRDPPIDVYDAVTWSSIVPLSIESVSLGGEPLNVPRFKA
jgi:predicted dehydrogenase